MMIRFLHLGHSFVYIACGASGRNIVHGFGSLPGALVTDD